MLYVPQYENLSIERILEQAKKNPRVSSFLPDDRDMHKVPRQWLINVTYTLMGNAFATWVSTEIANRNEELAKKQNLLIDMDPEIAAAFQKSVNISSKSSHSCYSTLIHQLIATMLYSYQWKQLTPSENWFQTSKNLSRDERTVGIGIIVLGS